MSDADRRAEAVANSSSTMFPYTPTRRFVEDYIAKGVIVLAPESLEIPLHVHPDIFKQELAAFQKKGRITASTIPDILKVTNAPGIRKACKALIGDNFAIVPFTHNTPFVSGSNDQHWHKDDTGPYNMRKQRHHQPVQLEMLYFPQEVRADMGPTAIVPYSQYWTFNHEENHDNFAGADHLDFDYQITGMDRIPVSGPRSTYDRTDIVNQSTEHDVRMREAVSNLQWPLCEQVEVKPLRAGSVILYSHNLLHRGNHRRDDWRTWKENPRFMWRFWLYRTTEPESSRMVVPVNWQRHRTDELTGWMIGEEPEDFAAAWRYQYQWTTGGCSSQPCASDHKEGSHEVELLAKQMQLRGDTNEPKRVGAAYRLAAHSFRETAVEQLGQALQSDRENVRRASLYGLIAVGEAATDVLLDAGESQARWVRKAAVFGLGSAGRLDSQVVDTLGRRLLEDASAYVRSVAADALGCVGRRIVAKHLQAEELVAKCASYLLESLVKEENRLSMDRAQGRSIKMVRPNDDCDVCEGMGFDYGQERYEPVRSVVRENVLWATVILCSHGADKLGTELQAVIEAMQRVIAEDKNLFSVGLAMDVLQRLVCKSSLCDSPDLVELRNALPEIFAQARICSLEALVASGMSPDDATQRYAPISRTNFDH